MNCSFYSGFFRGRENKFSAFSFSFWVVLKKIKEKNPDFEATEGFFCLISGVKWPENPLKPPLFKFFQFF